MSRNPTRSGRAGMVTGVALALYLFCSSIVSAEVPCLVNYQGRLTDASGAFVGDGQYAIGVSVFDSPTSPSRVWGPQTFPAVPVINGYFNVILGPTDEHQPSRTIESAFQGPARYLGVTLDGKDILPRQQVLSAPYSLYSSNLSMRGMIVMWSGALDKIPAGWGLCDGNNGTPDLRDRFVLGGGGNRNVGAAGGADLHNHEAGSYTMPAHNHGGKTGAPNWAGGNIDDNSGGSDYQATLHTHDVPNAPSAPIQGSSANASSMPPFYVLAYIMKL